ncbi:MAG: oxidoreductase [Actinomycetota bacterium]|nr:oxidoreductase [Actinomycetota bacterium]
MPSSSGSITDCGRIVATGPIAAPAPELLAPFGDLLVARSSDEEELLHLIPEAVALVVRGGGSRVTARVIDAAHELRVIARTGVGVDEVDLDAATRRGVPVVIVPDAGAQAVAEGALALLLALGKRLTLLDRLVREGRWAERDAVEIRDLEGSTLGIVGLGRIGRRLADLGRAVGMTVVAADPYADVAGSEVDLVTLFERSDFISLHAPLTDETRGMVDASLLARLPDGAILVNLARGALIRSLDDVLEALETGRLGGVGLDVFAEEPPDLSHPLFRHERVLVSPHALGMSRAAKSAIARAAAEGIIAVLRGDRPRAVANPEIYGR